MYALAASDGIPQIVARRRDSYTAVGSTSSSSAEQALFLGIAIYALEIHIA
jgi:hypothetical protein